MTSFHEFHRFHHIWSSETWLGILATDKPTHPPMTIRRIPWEMIDWSTKIHVRIGFLARMVSIVLLWRGCVKIREEKKVRGKKTAKKFRVRQRSELHLTSTFQLLSLIFTPLRVLCIELKNGSTSTLCIHAMVLPSDSSACSPIQSPLHSPSQPPELKLGLLYTLSEGFGVKQKGNYLSGRMNSGLRFIIWVTGLWFKWTMLNWHNSGYRLSISLVLFSLKDQVISIAQEKKRALRPNGFYMFLAESHALDFTKPP